MAHGTTAEGTAGDGTTAGRTTAERAAGDGTALPPGRSFGEQGGRLTYGSYLRLDALLSQQVLRSDPPAHDELLFVTVHQVYELWFQQLLHDLTSARDAVLGEGPDGQRENALWWARHLLTRAATIEQVLVRQVDVLETMTPQDFLAFREELAPASGFQSVQFRELEFLSGAKDPGFLERFRGLTDAEEARLRRRLAEPTLWDAYLHALGAAGLPTDDEDAVRASLLAVTRDRAAYTDLWELAERLVDHDAGAALWRARHVMMVERQIGTKAGTGGSSGAPYLRSRLGLRYFPLLWEVRSEL